MWTDWVYADGSRIAKASGNTVSYYYCDQLESTRLVTSSPSNPKNVQVLFSDTCQPYGQDNGTPTGSETYKFTGKPVSATTGLYYDYQRWYDPSIGRFVSQDPLAGHLSNPQTLNPYVYVTDTPTTATDETGLDRAFDHCDRVQCNAMTTCDLICTTLTYLIVGDAIAGGALLACIAACPFVTGGGLSAFGLCAKDPEVCETSTNVTPTTPPPPTSIIPPPAVTTRRRIAAQPDRKR